MRTVNRSTWGARAPLHAPTPIGTVLGMGVHYSAMNADERSYHTECAARVRAIQNFHMSPDPNDPSKPWNDIAYNWLVCKHGYVFVGRGRGIRSAANGTDSGNDHYPAVCFLGDDTVGRDDVTSKGRRALAELIARETGLVAGDTSVRPHSFFRRTTCPGDDLRAFCVELDDALSYAD